jgi:hypothetical protein
MFSTGSILIASLVLQNLARLPRAVFELYQSPPPLYLSRPSFTEYPVGCPVNALMPIIMAENANAREIL